ncbi:uncharacterized protein PSANT_03939 [Moesziomyces antarcticus]|uniref:Uncharacterized protein n=1 Tax=Pseudozyma antarctica TaxID=84753 RepID=A0A5C3FP98_PSEA2|nr:uncharacterized protein PSANT_03939 [Moesziomyces antarcticus]
MWGIKSKPFSIGSKTILYRAAPHRVAADPQTRLVGMICTHRRTQTRGGFSVEFSRPQSSAGHHEAAIAAEVNKVGKRAALRCRGHPIVEGNTQQSRRLAAFSLTWSWGNIRQLTACSRLPLPSQHEFSYWHEVELVIAGRLLVRTTTGSGGDVAGAFGCPKAASGHDGVSAYDFAWTLVTSACTCSCGDSVPTLIRGRRMQTRGDRHDRMRRGDGNSSILHHGGRLVSVERGLQRKAEVAGRRQSAGGATARAVRFRLISGWGPVRHCRGKAAPCEIEISRKGAVVVERKLASDLARARAHPAPAAYGRGGA